MFIDAYIQQTCCMKLKKLQLTVRLFQEVLTLSQAWMTIRGAATPLTWNGMWTCCAGWRWPQGLWQPSLPALALPRMR